MTAFDAAWSLVKGSPVPMYARTKDREESLRRNKPQRTRRGSDVNSLKPTQTDIYDHGGKDKELFMTGNVPLEPDFDDRARDLPNGS